MNIVQPVWYTAALLDIGKRESGDNEGPFIEQLIREAHCGHIHDPWCAIAINAWHERCNIPGTRSPSSQSFRSDKNFRQLTGPALGATVVFWRVSKSSGLGHCGLYDGETDAAVSCISGNAGDMVSRRTFPKASSKFGLVGYYWPASQPLPIVGKLPVPKASSAGGKVV